MSNQQEVTKQKTQFASDDVLKGIELLEAKNTQLALDKARLVDLLINARDDEADTVSNADIDALLDEIKNRDD